VRASVTASLCTLLTDFLKRPRTFNARNVTGRSSHVGDYARLHPTLGGLVL